MPAAGRLTYGRYGRLCSCLSNVRQGARLNEELLRTVEQKQAGKSRWFRFNLKLLVGIFQMVMICHWGLQGKKRRGCGGAASGMASSSGGSCCEQLGHVWKVHRAVAESTWDLSFSVQHLFSI